MIVSSVAESFGRSHAHVLRLNADLSIDATYGTGGSMTIEAFAPQDAALQPDGSLLLAGTTDGVPPSTPQALNLIWSLARVTSRGAVDIGFGTSGIVTIPTSVPSRPATRSLPDRAGRSSRSRTRSARARAGRS